MTLKQFFYMFVSKEYRKDELYVIKIAYLCKRK